MKRAVFCHVAAIAVAAFLVAAPARLYAQNAVVYRQRRYRRRGHRTAWSRSRRLGDRGNPRSADPLRQDRRDRRPGPLRRARPAESQISGLGARLWACRFAKGRRRRPASTSISPRSPAPDDAAAAKYYPAIYWFSMLKIPDKDQFGGKSDIPAERHAGRLAHDDQEPGLRRLPSTRSIGDTNHPGGAWAVQDRRGSLGAARSVRSGFAAHGQSARRQAWAACRSNISAIGPIASPKANCHSPSRRGRRASNAIS